MLIRIPVAAYRSEGNVVRVTYLVHSLTRPAVYLDHWALMLFGESAELGDRLVNALHNKGGCLCLSYLHAGELCQADDPRHADEVDRLVERLMPHVFLVRADHNLKRRGTNPLALVPDIQLAERLARMQLRPPGSPGYFRTFWNSRDLYRDQDGNTLRDVFAQATEAMVESFTRTREDIEFRERARTYKPTSNIAAGWVFLGELMKSDFLTPEEQLDTHDVVDIQHAINLLHCDFALLDRTWASKANQARDRLKKIGIEVAECFSRRNNGIERFLHAVEDYDAGRAKP